jgi:hypothetical protein
LDIKEPPLKLIAHAVLAAILVASIGSAAFGQSLEEKRDKKLASAFLKKAAWITDYDKALEEAKKTGRPIFGYFSRSYSP